MKRKINLKKLKFLCVFLFFPIILAGCRGTSSTGAVPSITGSAGTLSPTRNSSFTSGFYFGSESSPQQITYTDKSGQSQTVTAFPGEVILFPASASTSYSSIDNLVTSGGGQILAHASDDSVYLIGVKDGTEAQFISNALKNPLISDATPDLTVQEDSTQKVTRQILQSSSNSPTIIGNPYVGGNTNVFVVDDFTDNMTGQTISHGQAVLNVLGEGGGINVPPPSMTVSSNGSLLYRDYNTDIGLIAAENQGSASGRRVVINLSYSPTDSVSKLIFFYHNTVVLQGANPNWRNNTVLVESAGNEPNLNLYDVLSPPSNAIIFGSNVFIVGGLHSDCSVDELLTFVKDANGNYCPLNFFKYAPAIVGTLSGTSFAAPQVSRAVANALAANSSSSVATTLSNSGIANQIAFNCSSFACSAPSPLVGTWKGSYSFNAPPQNPNSFGANCSGTYAGGTLTLNITSAPITNQQNDSGTFGGNDISSNGIYAFTMTNFPYYTSGCTTSSTIMGGAINSGTFTGNSLSFTLTAVSPIPVPTPPNTIQPSQYSGWQEFFANASLNGNTISGSFPPSGGNCTYNGCITGSFSLTKQ